MRRNSNAFLSAQALLEALRSGIRLLFVGMLVLVFLYLTSGITVVAPHEVGVVMRFGKLRPEVHQPGMLLALPPPIDEVLKIPVKTMEATILDKWATAPGEQDVSLNPVLQQYTLTGDVNIVRARFVLRYQIHDPIEYLTSATEPGKLRDAILYECAAQIVASMKIEDALASQKFQLGQDAMNLAQEKISKLKLGYRLTAFEIQSITPPRAVFESFKQVSTAKLEARTMVEQANSYAAATLPDAQAEAYRIQQDADAYARRVVAQAHGASSGFLAQLKEYQANPEIVRARLAGEMRQSILPQAKKTTILPAGAGGKIFLTP